MPIILVFDTETTGFPPLMNMLKNTYKKRMTANALKTALFHSPEPNVEDWSVWSPKWNNIIQISYILYHTESNEFKTFDKYVELPIELVEGFLSKEETHNTVRDALIEWKAAKERGETQDLKDVMHQFLQDFERANIIVGHNVEYDKNMVLAELMSLHISTKDAKYLDTFMKLQNSDKFVCTAQRGVDICKIEHTGRDGKTFFKFPRLNQLYENLFGHSPDEKKLHNALNDVIVTFRCFYMIEYGEDIYGKNPEIDSLIDYITSGPDPDPDSGPDPDPDPEKSLSRGIKKYSKQRRRSKRKIYKGKNYKGKNYKGKSKKRSLKK